MVVGLLFWISWLTILVDQFNKINVQAMTLFAMKEIFDRISIQYLLSNILKDLLHKHFILVGHKHACALRVLATIRVLIL